MTADLTYFISSWQKKLNMVQTKIVNDEYVKKEAVAAYFEEIPRVLPKEIEEKLTYFTASSAFREANSC